VGVAVAPLISHLLRSFMPAGADVTSDIDGRVLLFALTVSIITGAICGVAPCSNCGVFR
jgi:hypothetical protein